MNGKPTYQLSVKHISWKTTTLYEHVLNEGSLIYGNWSISIIDSQLYCKHKNITVLITDADTNISSLEYNKLTFPIDEQDDLYIIHDSNLYCILEHAD